MWIIEDWQRFISAQKPDPVDLVRQLPVFVVLTGAARYLLHHYVFKPMSKALVPETPSKLNPLEDCDLRRRKFMESCWKFLFYAATWLYTTWAAGYQRDWVSETVDGESWFFDGESYFNMEILNQTDLNLDLRIIYMIQLSYYIFSLVTIYFSEWEISEVKRTDAREMTIHHLVTIFLVGFSYYCNWCRIGIIILVIHDCSDVIMEMAKLTNYVQLPSYYMDGLFVVFVAVWCYSRLYLYPMYPLRIVWSKRFLYPTWVYQFVGPLAALQVLHWYWTVLIFHMVYRFLVLKKVEDIRELSHGTDGEKGEKRRARELQHQKHSHPHPHPHQHEPSTKNATPVKAGKKD